MTKDLTEALRQASGQGCAAPSSTTYTPKQLPNVPVLPPIPPRSGSAKAQLPAAPAGDGGASGIWMTDDGIFTLVVD